MTGNEVANTSETDDRFGSDLTPSTHATDSSAEYLRLIGIRKMRVSSFIFPVLTALLFVGCRTLETKPAKVVSIAGPAATKGVLTDVSNGIVERFGPNQSGFHLIPGSADALNWRLALADHATTSIDIQYYLWADDETGYLLLNRLIQAANRGVRVRILIDDLLHEIDDQEIAALSHHPNFEIRLYNPTRKRGGFPAKAVSLATNFDQLNQRMHNKLFIADGRVSILGGRNIGNAYFGLAEKFNFLDLDVIAVGPISDKIGEAFDEYWNSDAAYPGQMLDPRVTAAETSSTIERLEKEFSENLGILAETNYSLQRKDWQVELQTLQSAWHPGTARMVQDSPEAGEDIERRRFFDYYKSLLKSDTAGELIIVSPYLIPEQEAYDSLENYNNGGTEVILLSTCLESNNHTYVNSHYKKHRRKLINQGSQLYEMRGEPSDSIRALADVSPIRSKMVSMHVRGAVGNRTHCYIGSLNLDPRSIELNTENGLIIHSPSLSKETADFFSTLMSEENSWEVTLDENDQLKWESMDQVIGIQPALNLSSRLQDFLFRLLPIEHQL